MNNQEISKFLRAVAAAHEIKNESLFKIRAYDDAADSIEHATREVKDLWEDGKLRELPTIGENIASHLHELFTTGNVKHFVEVFHGLPPAMFEFLDIPGIGPKTAYKLAIKLKISNKKNAVERLFKAAESGKIRNIKGFGEDSEKAILKGIEEYRRLEKRMLLPVATLISEELINYMKNCEAVLRIDALGSLRRRCATIGDIDIAVATLRPNDVIDHFISFPRAKKILASGENTARLIHKSGYQIDIKLQTPAKYGALLQHFTGSKNHNIHLRELAIKKGYSLSEYGIKIRGKIKDYKDEESFYKTLDLDWIPPELREDTGEIEAASSAKLPKLIDFQDIRGDLHLHSNYPWQSSHDSGTASMGELLIKAKQLGYEYLGIGDHNPSTSKYKKDNMISDIRNRSNIIEELNYSHEYYSDNRTIHILNNLEIDIMVDGKLAIPDEALQMLDYAVVSVHSSMRMSKEKMTQRILKGLLHPKAKILGHPTGRLLNKREGYEVDWEVIFKFMKEKRKYLEINAWPSRLDLPDTLVRQAIKNGVQLVINTDAHDLTHLDFMRYGVDVARRGWASKKDILNTLPWNMIEKYLIN